mmetsp:Transcript_54283/g.118341  ORF Transcript_54283/g.118341 Transcript_54283/m.118341 type:complete len:233 (+) Transcript_54283:754-1452(+)|eukprot:CAMPEP_0116921334 /NCGR_PEP_ID=MMETSP0467-20121206/21567_1 /TAXON_ID=283647 /ORGANISM="Mesodinium pulex, Strain SPMC105" /LENGTH=232 /DNA_ID=CAMNT_0004599379 /DNA_START=1194 /DNA_END=1892 /DNA_ORIENTATION=-
MKLSDENQKILYNNVDDSKIEEVAGMYTKFLESESEDEETPEERKRKAILYKNLAKECLKLNDSKKNNIRNKDNKKDNTNDEIDEALSQQEQGDSDNSDPGDQSGQDSNPNEDSFDLEMQEIENMDNDQGYAFTTEFTPEEDEFTMERKQEKRKGKKTKEANVDEGLDLFINHNNKDSSETNAKDNSLIKDNRFTNILDQEYSINPDQANTEFNKKLAQGVNKNRLKRKRNN